MNLILPTNGWKRGTSQTHFCSLEKIVLLIVKAAILRGSMRLFVFFLPNCFGFFSYGDMKGLFLVTGGLADWANRPAGSGTALECDKRLFWGGQRPREHGECQASYEVKNSVPLYGKKKSVSGGPRMGAKEVLISPGVLS